MKLRPAKRKVWVTVALMCLVVFCITSLFTTATAAEDEPITEITQITVTVDDVQYDLSDYDSANEYIDAYDTNVNADPNFDQNLETALGTDYGLSDTPGFLKTGYYPFNISGNSGVYAYHDTNREYIMSGVASVFKLALLANDPNLAALHLDTMEKSGIIDFLRVDIDIVNKLLTVFV